LLSVILTMFKREKREIALTVMILKPLNVKSLSVRNNFTNMLKRELTTVHAYSQ